MDRLWVGVSALLMDTKTVETMGMILAVDLETKLVESMVVMMVERWVE